MNYLLKLAIHTFLGLILISGIIIPVFSQEMTLDDVRKSLLANPPEIGDSAVRRNCFKVLDDEFKSPTANTDTEIRDFYNNMIKQVKGDILNPESAQVVIYKMYNLGFIIKMQELVVAIDLVRGMSSWNSIPDEIINQIDVILVTHEHSDHFDPAIISKVVANGGVAVVPSEMTYSGTGVMKFEAGDSTIISGVKIKAYDGLHNVPLRIYEITSPSGLRIVHTGDNQASYTLPDIEDINILLLDCWVNESDGSFSNVLGMQYCLEKLQPEIMIPGHFNELSHTPSQRYAYDSAFKLMEKDIPSDVEVMAWGEKFVYNPGVVLPVYKTGNSLQIDGMLDDAWTYTPEVLMLRQVLDVPDDWLDLYGKFRVMWDDTDFYLFVSVQDDTIRTDNAESWYNDVIELFFDGDNSKNDTIEGYDDNDTQMRFEYMSDDYKAPHSEYQFLETDRGYNFEARIPVSDLKFDLVSDLLLGFDIQVSDNDDGTQNSIIRWWSDNINNYKDPSLFGTAKLSGKTLSEIYEIPYTPSPLQIDGNTDYAWIVGEKHVINHLIFGEEFLDTPGDAVTYWKALWDENYLYFLIEVEDDTLINDSENDYYQDDCIEFWIDGDNSKNESHDNINDFGFQFRYQSDSVLEQVRESIGPPVETSGIKQKAKLTENGFVTEIAYPLEILGIEPYDSTYFGFDIDYNDDDDGNAADTKFKLYAEEDAAWQTPSAWGTAILMGSGLKEESPVSPSNIGNPHAETLVIKVYPNPADDELYIVLPRTNETNVQIQITDISGRVVDDCTYHIISFSEHKLAVDVSDLSEGIYFIKVDTLHQSYVQKVIKR